MRISLTKTYFVAAVVLAVVGAGLISIAMWWGRVTKESADRAVAQQDLAKSAETTDVTIPSPEPEGRRPNVLATLLGLAPPSPSPSPTPPVTIPATVTVVSQMTSPTPTPTPSLVVSPSPSSSPQSVPSPSPSPKVTPTPTPTPSWRQQRIIAELQQEEQAKAASVQTAADRSYLVSFPMMTPRYTIIFSQNEQAFVVYVANRSGKSTAQLRNELQAEVRQKIRATGADLDDIPIHWE